MRELCRSFPTALEPSHAYVSVSASNEINRLVIVLIRPPLASGEDKVPVVDQRQFNVAFFRSFSIRRYLVGEGVAFCLWRQTPSSRMSLCNYMPQKTVIPCLFMGRDERQERQGHVIAPLTHRGGEEVRDTENRRTKGW